MHSQLSLIKSGLWNYPALGNLACYMFKLLSKGKTVKIETRVKAFEKFMKNGN